MLIDFGVSKQVAGKLLSRVGTIVGTSGYAPIEQMRGQVYPASDLYSLGVACVRLLTQCLPKEDGSDDIYDALNGRWIWRDRLPKNTNISPSLEQVLDKLLQDYVKNRYQSADEVLEFISFTINHPNSNNLSSAVGVDYTKLRDLLATGKWKDADQETWFVMLKIADREKERYLREEDIKKFPCQDLCTIDQLWLNYSNGCFGFSVQKHIWDSVGGNPNLNLETWKCFGERVGWRVQNTWKPYEALPFSLASPMGQLPRAIWSMRVDGRRRRLSSVASRLVDCKI